MFTGHLWCIFGNCSIYWLTCSLQSWGLVFNFCSLYILNIRPIWRRAVRDRLPFCSLSLYYAERSIPFHFMESHLQILGLTSCAIRVFFPLSSCLSLYSDVLSLLSPSAARGLLLRSFIYFELIFLCKIKDRDLISFFCMLDNQLTQVNFFEAVTTFPVCFSCLC